MRRLYRTASLVGITAFLVVGCGDDAPGGGNNNANDNINQNCLPDMSIQGASQLNLMINAEVDLTVLVADCNGDAIPGAVVNFDLGGNNGGSTLNVMSSVTGSDGLASVTLTAGGSNATFTITASTAGADDVSWDITVTSDPIGLIVVNMTYAGQKAFDTYESYLFQNNNCGGLDPFNIQGAVMGAAPVSVISAHPQFPGVPEGSGYSVAVVASFGNEVLAWGCVDALSVSPGQITEADVTIEDIPVEFNGLYYLDNQFDLANALPPSISTVLHILDELTDDHSLAGDSATHQYGLDPAAFLLDFIFRQFCHWECTNGQDYSSCSEINHNYGDLQGLYDHDFQTWSGAQPWVTGACGFLDQTIGSQDIHQHAQQYLQDFIDDYVPDFVTNLLTIFGDIARVFTQMNIQSELTVSEIDISKQGDFLHELITLVVPLHDQNGVLHTYYVDLANAGMTNVSYSGSTSASDTTLTIPPHSFQLEFGKLLQYIYLNYVLPLFNVTSTADLLGLWINCTAVGTWLYDNLISGSMVDGFISESDMQSYCTAGLNAAGGYIDDNIDDWIGVTSTFELQGTCDAGDLDDERVAITLVNGVWNGEITESGFNATFPGTFTGSKTAP